MSPVELLGMLLGLLFTLSIFTYIFGDNGLFRFTIHIFIGVSAAYAVAAALYYVILPKLVQPLMSGDLMQMVLALVPVLLSILLLMKASQRFSSLGHPAVLFLVGVGAATAIGGAVLGTLFPQVQAAWNGLDRGQMQQAAAQGSSVSVQLLVALFVLIATLTTLAYFQFGAHQANGERPARRGMIAEALAKVGQLVIAVTFGVLFAGVFTASLVALIERVQWIASSLSELLAQFL